MKPFLIFIGWDPREAAAYDVLRWSIQRSGRAEIVPLMQQALRGRGLYRRTYRVDTSGNRFDDVDNPRGEMAKPFSTEFSFTRFLVPALAALDYPDAEWALFCDCDMMFRRPLSDLLELADPSFAVQVVKHHHVPREVEKMDDCIQTRYHRKNWSSFILWNLRHPANDKLTVDLVNDASGGWLHGFGWLDSDLIGELPTRWNWLEGTSDPGITPANVHWTRGGPWFKGYQDVAFADEWRDAYRHATGVRDIVGQS